MFAPCPHCGFLVALIVTDGVAPPRCPRCEQGLDARAIQAPVSAAQTPVFPVAMTLPDDEVVATPRDTAGDASGHADCSLPLPAVPPALPLPTLPPVVLTVATAPRFLRGIAAPARVDSRRWPGVLGALLLGALLVVQLALSQRAELAASEHWRPLIGSVCRVVGCTIPPWHEPAAYTMLARDVQPAPGQPGVLQVRASFRNDARWPQPWPVLRLQLTDLNGRTVAARQLQPADYHAADAPHPAALAPGQSASVELRVLEPATPIVAFDFEFR